MTGIPLSTKYSEQPGRIIRIWRFVLRQIGNPWRSALLHLVGLTIAEATTTLVDPRLGMIFHGLVLVGLFLQASFIDHGRRRGFFLSLAMAPLIRLLSLSLPLPHFPFVYWYAVVGAPLLLSAYAMSRIGKVNRQMQGFTLRKIPSQLLVAATGIGLGYLEYMILQPEPLISELRFDLIWAPALILLIFTGFLEEWIFRGLMQYTAIRSFGRLGFYYVAAVFAVLHLGYRSVLDVAFVFAVAVFFGWVVQRTGSISGVTIAHGLTNIGLFLIFPFIVSSPTGPVPVTPETFATIPATTAPAAEAFPTPSSTPTVKVVRMAPGLLGPVVTSEATRPWVPPTFTPKTSTMTPTLIFTATIVPTETQTPIPVETTAISTSTVCGPPAGWVRYVIQSGDTLSVLSRRLNISIAQLRAANCLTSDAIYWGQILYVPFLPQESSATPLPTVTPQLPTNTPTPTLTNTLQPPTPTVPPSATSSPPFPTITEEPTLSYTATWTPTLPPTVETSTEEVTETPEPTITPSQ